MTKDENYDNWLSGGIILITLIVLVILALEFQHLDHTYVFIFCLFMGIAILGLLVLWALPKFLNIEEGYGTEPFRHTFASQWWARLAGAIFLIIIFTGGIIATQHTIVPIVNPYDSGKIIESKEVFSTQGVVKTAVRTGTYASFGEDLLGYVLVTAATVTQLFIWRRFIDDAFENIALIGLSVIIACALWALSFSLAHSAIYGLDSQAYWSAAVFGFTSQLVNQIVGAPVSLLAHFTHNFVYVLKIGITLSIGGTAAFLLLRKSNKVTA